MSVETKDKPLSAEDVTRIIEQSLDRRDAEARKKRRDGVHVEDAELARLELQAEKIGEAVGAAVEAALNRHAAKQAEADKAAEEKQEKRGFRW